MRLSLPRSLLVPVGVAVLLGVALLAGPPLGTDLSAQVAHADFFREHGFTPVDLRWYGGTQPLGYSWTSPPLMALLGARLTGVLALLAATAGFAVLLARVAAPRPMLGGVLAAVTFAGNLVSGRVTFALGVAFGVWALVGCTSARPWVRSSVAFGGALLAAATSPVAGLFVGLAGVALLAVRRVCGVAVALGAALPLGVTALLFSDGGTMNFGRTDATHAFVTAAAVAALVPRRAVRVGAALSCLLVLAAYLVPTPVGLNATRLATMFALPVVAAFATLRLRWLVPALVALSFWQQPVIRADLRDAGNPTTDRAYFAPLLTELAAWPPGRVEVPPTRDYWEAAYVQPLARGWLRQVDLAQNELFFDAALTPEEYEAWLRDNGVRYVALPDATLSWIARSERRVIAGRPAYLREVWHDTHWTLFEVTGEPSIVDGATLVSATATSITFDALVAGDVLVRARWSRWLRVDGATIVEDGRWLRVHVPAPGRYVLTS